MSWGNVIDFAGVLAPVAVALVVALMVSGRDDRRLREAEHRAVQRETIIALQDGWFEQDEKWTNVRHLIETHHAIANNVESEMMARAQALQRGEVRDTSREAFEQEWDRAQVQADEVNQSGKEMVDALIDLRRFARHIALLESRVSAEGVKRTSKVMREYVEAMIVDVGSHGGNQYDAIRKDQFEPAYDRFIAAGYAVLADIDATDTEAARRWRRWWDR